jgi:hypothetical protein
VSNNAGKDDINAVVAGDGKGWRGVVLGFNFNAAEEESVDNAVLTTAWAVTAGVALLVAVILGEANDEEAFCWASATE